MGDRLTFLSDMKLGVLLISFPPPLQPRPIIPETTSTLNISSSVDHDGPYFSRYFKTNDMQEKITPVLNPESKKQKLSAGTELRSLSKSDQSQTYALKVSTILAGPHKDSFFGGFVRFSEHSNHHSDDDNSSTTTATVVTPPIIRYECKVGTYEQFKGGYNLLTSCRSKPEEIDAASDLFAYFNFDTRCILVDLASSPNDDENGNNNILKQKKTGRSEIQKLLEFEKVGWYYIRNKQIGRDLELGNMPVSRWASEEERNAPPVPIALTLDSFMWAYCENGLKHVQEVRI
jgi:hypothetical protein